MRAPGGPSGVRQPPRPRLRSSGRTDQWLLFASAGLRACAVGISGIILALHLATIGFDASAIGFTVTSSGALDLLEEVECTVLTRTRRYVFSCQVRWFNQSTGRYGLMIRELRGTSSVERSVREPKLELRAAQPGACTP